MLLYTIWLSGALLIFTLNRYGNSCVQTSVVFSAANQLTVPGPLSPLPYDVILVDTHDGFDVTRSTYTVPQTGFYLLSMSVGVPAYQMANYTLHGALSAPNIPLTHTTYDGELVTSRDDLQYLIKDQQLYTSSQYDVYSDGMLQTTLGGFKINDVMNSKGIYFRAASTSNQVAAGNVVLDQMIINSGQAMNQCNSQLVVPYRGIYFLSYSTASIQNTTHEVQLMVNNALVSRSFVHASYTGIDTSSHMMMLRLDVDDVVHLYSVYGNISSSINYQTSFQGFLYEPLHGFIIAWTLSFPTPPNVNLYGPIERVNFTAVILNEGSAWQGASAVLVVPMSGIYYLKLSGESWPIQYAFNLVLSVNGRPLMNVMQKVGDTRNGGGNLRNRALIYQLRQGDQLTVSIPAGYNAYSFKYDLVFAGFLIEPVVTG